jgi:hypothetical protein
LLNTASTQGHTIAQKASSSLSNGRGRSSFYGCTDVRDRRAADFDSTIRRFDPSRPSQPNPAFDWSSQENQDRAGNTGVFDFVSRLPFADFGTQIAESLQPCPRIFPFCGDYPHSVSGKLFAYTRVEFDGLVKAHDHVFGYCGAAVDMLAEYRGNLESYCKGLTISQ